jgi:hypothetical protein
MVWKTPQASPDVRVLVQFLAGAPPAAARCACHDDSPWTLFLGQLHVALDNYPRGHMDHDSSRLDTESWLVRGAHGVPC